MKIREVELFIDDELITLVVDENDLIIEPAKYVDDKLVDLMKNEVDYSIEIGHAEWLDKKHEANKLYADLIPENGHLKKDGYIPET